MTLADLCDALSRLPGVERVGWFDDAATENGLVIFVAFRLADGRRATVHYATSQQMLAAMRADPVKEITQWFQQRMEEAIKREGQ